MSKIDPNNSIRAKGMAHKLVGNTAREMARAVWEEGATRHNDWRKMWPSEEGFVQARWTSFIQPAVENLAELLNRHHGLSQEDRDAIHEAILLHRAVNPAINSPSLKPLGKQ